MDLVTIYVTSYNRPDLLQGCLQSIVEQTFQDWHVVILDDASTADYSHVLEEFVGPRIEYRRNANNLGGMNNIAQALSEPASTDYVMVFHDDDLMHPRLLELEIEVLTKLPELRFVATENEVFIGRRIPSSARVRRPRPPVVFTNPSQLTVAITRGLRVTHSSVMYNAKALPGTVMENELYSILADRPYLLELLRRGPGGFIPEPLVVTRHHTAQISETVDDLSDDHVIAICDTYRSVIQEAPSLRSMWAFHCWTGREAVRAFLVTDPSNRRRSLLGYLRHLHANGDLRYPFLLLFFYRPIRIWALRIPRMLKRMFGATIGTKKAPHLD